MSHALPATAPSGATTLGDRGASYLRTVIPVVWGTAVAQLLAWLSPRLPGDIGASLTEWLSGEAAIATVTAAVIALWYVLWRKLETHMPDWLTRLVLGSAAAPTYARVAEGEVAAVTTVSAVPDASSDEPVVSDDDFVVHDINALDLPEITNTRDSSD